MNTVVLNCGSLPAIMVTGNDNYKMMIKHANMWSFGHWLLLLDVVIIVIIIVKLLLLLLLYHDDHDDDRGGNVWVIDCYYFML